MYLQFILTFTIPGCSVYLPEALSLSEIFFWIISVVFFFTPLRSATVISLVSGPFGCCHYSVTKSCLPLCNPMYYSMSGSSVLHFWSLLKFMSIELVMLSNHLILCLPLLLLPSIFPASGSFPLSWLFTSDGQSIGASALVLPMSIQGWFSLRLTGLISLLSKGLSRVFSSTTIWRHQCIGTQPSLWANSHLYMTTAKTVALNVWIYYFKCLLRYIPMAGFKPRLLSILLICRSFLSLFSA